MTTITNIAGEHYFNGGDGIYGAARKAGDESIQAFHEALDRVTFCLLVLDDGSAVTGESVCANAGTFDAEAEKKIARQSAMQKVSCQVPKGDGMPGIVSVCHERAKPGGCQLHNLQCGWPACNKRPRKGQE